MRKWIQRGVNCLTWLILITVLVYFGPLGGWRDATVGRFHRKAFELFSDTDGITKVEVFLLSGEDANKQKETFPLRPYGSTTPVYGRLTLTGSDLDRFLELWSSQAPTYWGQAMCHKPVYGYRLFRKGKLAGETSICWECSNYYVSIYPGISGWYGFRADIMNARDLLAFCDARLPYKRSEMSHEDSRAEQGGAEQPTPLSQEATQRDNYPQTE